MKTSYQFILAFFLLLSIDITNAQPTDLSEIKVGENVPEYALSGWLKDSAKTVSVSELHNHKLLILDFWATWCGSCIYELPKLDSLKNVFGDKVEVVAAGYQDYNTIGAFFKQNPAYEPHYLRVLTNDHILLKLFPHKSLPHMVWINSEGKVAAITDGEDVTANNIRAIINNGHPAIELKKDVINFDFRHTFHLRDTSFSGRSIFTNRTAGIFSYEGTFGDKPGIINRIFASNLPIRTLYWIAAFHHELSFTNFDRIFLEVRDSLKYMQPKFAYASYKKSKYFDPESWHSTSWEKDNLYCYELILPQERQDTILYQYMISDLNRYLNLNGRFEKRLMDCFVLTYEKNGAQSLKVSAQKPDIVYQQKKSVSSLDVPVALKAQNIGMLVKFLNMTIDKSQIVDETGIDKHLLLDFDLSALKKGYTMDQINKLLEPYGLTLRSAKRNVRVFVLSEI
jgi:thiol-disulfide isomerase/thioredoxin